MALITCPDCNKEISDAAPACPGCGRPADSKRETRTETAREAENPEAPKKRKKRRERVLFEDGLVKITNVRAIISANQTYAMSNVTSVQEFIEGRPAAFLLLGVLLVVPGVFCTSIKVANSAAYGWIAVLLGAACVVGYFFQKTKHWVRIGTAGGEANAVWSHNQEWTRNVVAAMNEAIVARG